jgi:hypothetical protein
MGGAPLQLPYKPRRHRVLQGSYCRLELQDRLVVAQRSRGAEQHQAGDALRAEFCHAPGGEAAPRVADQAGALGPDGVQEGHHVGGEVLDAVAAGWPLGVAVAALVHGKAW